MNRYLALALALSCIAAPAAADPSKPATVVYCNILWVHNCDTQKCETSKPRKTTELQIDYKSSTVCIRATPKCLRPRRFEVVSKGNLARLLTVAKDGTVLRISEDWHLSGSEVRDGKITNFFGLCGRA